MKCLKWTGKNGNELELRAKCKIEMVDKIVDADGHKVLIGKEKGEKALLEFWADGKRMETCNGDINWWRIIDNGNLKQIWGLRKLGFTPEQAEVIQEFLNSVIETGKAEGVVEVEKEDEKLENERRVKMAEDIMKKAAKQGKVMTADEYEIWRLNYNNIANEGGDGYIPETVTVEELEWAKTILDKQ